MLILPGGYDLYSEAQLAHTLVQTMNTSESFPQVIATLEDVRDKGGWCLCRAMIDPSAAQGKSSIELSIKTASTADFPGPGDLSLYKLVASTGEPVYFRFPLNRDTTFVVAELEVISIGSHSGAFNAICQIWTDVEYVLKEERHQLHPDLFDWATVSWFRDLDNEGTV